jgi:hypothetical protein
MGKLVAEKLQRDTVLQGDGQGLGKTAYQAGYGGPFLRHRDEYFTRPLVWIQTHRDVSLMSPNAEFVRHGDTLVGKVATDRPGWRVITVPIASYSRHEVFPNVLSTG